MSSKPREWPNMASYARDRAAEEAVKGLNAIWPLIERDVTEMDRLRRLTIAINAFQQIARHLESVGAQTRPE